MKAAVWEEKSHGKRVGFVPTMGFLHEGHLSLVRACVQKTGCSVVSIFVNPTQFGPQEDFKDYPRDVDRDISLIKAEGVDYAFIPDAEEMYPVGFSTYAEVHELQDRLCGRSRTGHFRGVCTVVLKLFHIVEPDIAFFGQKDAQQAIILKKMIRDLDLGVKIEVLPIIREEDGLALSSRNLYLDKEQRKSALCLFQSLREAEQMVKSGEKNAKIIVQRMREIIQSGPQTRIDYVEIVDMDDLLPVETIDGEKDALIAMAVFIGPVRLIDNTIVRRKE